MSYSVSRSPSANRVMVVQQTPHSCLPASIVDGLGDIVGWTAVERRAAQWDLIRALGGLRGQGSTLDRGASAVHSLWGASLLIEVGTAPLSEVVGRAALGAATVIGLAPLHPGAAEGHAVRLETGEGSLPQRSGDAFLDAVLQQSDEKLADMARFAVRLFDPWPGIGSTDSSVPDLRPRYEAAGGQALIISRKPSALARSDPPVLGQRGPLRDRALGLRGGSEGAVAGGAVGQTRSARADRWIGAGRVRFKCEWTG